MADVEGAGPHRIDLDRPCHDADGALSEVQLRKAIRRMCGIGWLTAVLSSLPRSELGAHLSTMTTVIWLAIAVGVATVLQAQFMGLMTERLGTVESVFITYGLGGGLAAVAMLVARGGNLGEWRVLPWWAFLAGVAGLVIVTGIGISVSRIGIVTTMTVIIATQFVASALVDQYGWFEAVVRPITLSRGVGLGVMLIGTWLVLR